MRIAAIYARVSSEQQREEHTIASQTAALLEFAKSRDLEVPKEWVFEASPIFIASLLINRSWLTRSKDHSTDCPPPRQLSQSSNDHSPAPPL